ncbi:MAG: hypothetical protein HY360_18025 [Verrucomicrobia bacterium]|nr:hypothetical protein [Verrucomicrobiota bacterium]
MPTFSRKRRIQAAMLAALAGLLSFQGHPVLAETKAPNSASDREIIDGKRKLDGLRLELITTKGPYEMGEPMEVAARYTYSGQRKLLVVTANPGRFGCVSPHWFTASDEKGSPVRDPLHGNDGRVAPGGGMSFRRLWRDQPVEQTCLLNEWLIFDRPGRYQVQAHSHRVEFANQPANRPCGAVIPLKSDPVEITVIPADETRRGMRIAELSRRIKDANQETRLAAIRDMGFLADERCIPSLIQALDDDATTLGAYFGLISFADPVPVKKELLKLVQDKKHFIPVRKMGWVGDLLARADSHAVGDPTIPTNKNHPARVQSWHEKLRQRFREQLEKLPSAQAASATVEALEFGHIIPSGDVKAWKRIMANAESLSGYHQNCAGTLLEKDFKIPQLIPDLKAIVRNEKLSDWLRSSAIAALHKMGDDTFSDMVKKDLVLPHPCLTQSAHETVTGSGRDLLLIVRSKREENEVRAKAAQRLRDLETDVTADQLVDALKELQTADSGFRDPLLEALVMKSQRDAVPWIRQILRKTAGKPRDWSRQNAIRLACRINLPESMALIEEIFRSKEAEDRSQIADELGQTWADADSDDFFWGYESAQKYLRGTKETAGPWVPDLLHLCRSDPSAKVRFAARAALCSITGIPSSGFSSATREEEAAWVSQWEAWWKSNQKRFPRQQP